MSDKSVCKGCALFVEPDDDGYPCPVADGYNGLIDEVLRPLGVVTHIFVTECPLRLQLDETLLVEDGENENDRQAGSLSYERPTADGDGEGAQGD